ncbi:GntR family transcriptional regulator [Coraliomargarita sp. SDUM461004]|uniref:GntR family transcriptional regulator n=1 Tax=Thalassobacterium sedimentorum TaxID=3041258 RepID=A0ABU1AIB3_9BACT|nr:GntR family transcriptional regulator [Coraliomargarita sp. SDUM461004]MDQ8194518.1 GntR family transcriptional regulator [Coraliomargarita sp. SDUM461004]
MNIPLYSDLAKTLRKQILNGQLAAGTRLPAERMLCEQFSASRVTVRQALAILEKEQLLTRIQGSGTYVSDAPQQRIPLSVDYTRSVQEHAPELKRKLIDHAYLKADKNQAKLLKSSIDTPILHARRQDLLNKRGAAWDIALIPEPFTLGLTTRQLSKVNFIEEWTKTLGLEMSHCEQTIHAKPAGPDDVELLGLSIGSPILVTQEIFLLENKRIAGAFITHYHPELIDIRHEFSMSSRSI